ncbi:unnamed protein product, partial [Heterotrigona itama]
CLLGILHVPLVRRSPRLGTYAFAPFLFATLSTAVVSSRQQRFYGCPVLEADRELVENNPDQILPKHPDENVAFLVVGDPFAATTHADLVLRARRKGAKVRTARSLPSSFQLFLLQVNVVHNSSIFTAVGCSGLQLYRFGQTVSIPCWDDRWRPDSFYDKIISNRRADLHTLCLLDIKVKEPTTDSIVKRNKQYLPSRFMTVSEAAAQLLNLVRENSRRIPNQETGKQPSLASQSPRTTFHPPSVLSFRSARRVRSGGRLGSRGFPRSTYRRLPSRPNGFRRSGPSSSLFDRSCRPTASPRDGISTHLRMKRLFRR